MAIANVDLQKAQAELDEKQAELDVVQAEYEKALMEKQVFIIFIRISITFHKRLRHNSHNMIRDGLTSKPLEISPPKNNNTKQQKVFPGTQVSVLAC